MLRNFVGIPSFMNIFLFRPCPFDHFAQELVEAARQGDIAEVLRLVDEAGVPAGAPAEGGVTAVHAAAGEVRRSLPASLSPERIMASTIQRP